MSSRVSLRQKLIGHLEDADSILRDILATASKKKSVTLLPLIELLLEKDQQLKETYKEMEAYNEIQMKIDLLKADCSKSDKQIQSCQLHLKKTEVILSTALYYSRQKLDSMTTAVKNPIDMEDLVRFSHRISATHGVIAPDNWTQGDPRRPYPNKEEIRRGYLGHIDDTGNFRPSLWEALSETAAAAASIAVPPTPPVSSSSGANSSCNSSILAPQNPAYHANQTQPTSLPLVTCSPNMILPGVNMVSSPISSSQSGASSTWTTPNVNFITANPTSSELASSQASASRPPSTSLAAMLTGTNMMDQHSRNITLPPPPLKLATNQSQANQITSFRSSSVLPRHPNIGNRQTFPSSPNSSGSQHIQYSNCDANPNFKSGGKTSRSCSKRTHSKHTGTECTEMSSNSSSDSSSGEE
ncbi:Mediator of RNA polymerase II transcription subunit 4 isoform 2 [Schistosoma japonicum]|uniref:Mediator of RNA polymerase II transcription subunit 4 n=3 Tax=Schistosoma japonicum TaxID=6182 RepID=A0A4Z2DNB5_SCHJA|nr:Mediator of RNA polymerase II transcription subunit 4 [Schistosoma japonicum]KAH8860605.1 Mediator of RNA polymerase II transcription subunit 4 [Schistosoma japonicum]TNN17882.1 Mediator of RNA polymerase II transcription subunit 4 isoform 2 [Schistosoma japonicum]